MSLTIPGQKLSLLEQISRGPYIDQFNEPGPYYTSYPTLGLWSEGFNHESYTRALENFFQEEGAGVSLALYIHIPFCAKLCWYCICNLVVSNDRQRIQKFLDHLLLEMDMLLDFFKAHSIRPNILEIHLGGGTPSHLENDQFSQLISKIEELAPVRDLDELAMEIDPRTSVPEDLEFYSSKGVTRISFGVQDFDLKVQQAINRIQPPEMVAALLTPQVRKSFSGVNFDLLYGLPLQSRRTFRETVRKVKELSPERVTLLKYAHVPNVRKHMDLIKESDLPPPGDFPSIFAETVEDLLANGYEWIGIDNFAKHSDVLADAARRKTIGRDFNGWNTGRAKHLIGLGPTTTCAFGNYYSQTVYELNEYYEAIERRKFPILRGYQLQWDDALRRDVMFGIMCSQAVDFEAIGQKYRIDCKEYFKEEIAVLNDGFIRDGKVIFSGNRLELTRFGRLFTRHVCRVFDRFWKGKTYEVTGP